MRVHWITRHKDEIEERRLELVRSTNHAAEHSAVRRRFLHSDHTCARLVRRPLKLDFVGRKRSSRNPCHDNSDATIRVVSSYFDGQKSIAQCISYLRRALGE